MTNVREIRSAPAAIADSLEKMAADIRSGKLPARHAIVVIEQQQESDHVTIGFAYFGNQRTATQMAGMLECAKFNVLRREP